MESTIVKGFSLISERLVILLIEAPCLEAAQCDAQLSFSQNLRHRAFDGIIASALWQQVDLIGYQRHKVARVLIQEQIHIHPVGVERIKETQQGSLRPAEFHIVHVDEYAWFCHLVNSI